MCCLCFVLLGSFWCHLHTVTVCHIGLVASPILAGSADDPLFLLKTKNAYTEVHHEHYIRTCEVDEHLYAATVEYRQEPIRCPTMPCEILYTSSWLERCEWRKFPHLCTHVRTAYATQTYKNTNSNRKRFGNIRTATALPFNYVPAQAFTRPHKMECVRIRACVCIQQKRCTYATGMKNRDEAIWFEDNVLEKGISRWCALFLSAVCVCVFALK